MSFTCATGWDLAEAERAFGKAIRARRFASLLRWLRGACAECASLSIHQLPSATRRGARGVVREIALEAITGSIEPSRATQFDGDFRPSPATRTRWLRVWQAEQRGAGLPPISVVAVDDGYAIRDGHHRVSVARARGARSIAAAIA